MLLLYPIARFCGVKMTGFLLLLLFHSLPVGPRCRSRALRGGFNLFPPSASVVWGLLAQSFSQTQVSERKEKKKQTQNLIQILQIVFRLVSVVLGASAAAAAAATATKCQNVATYFLRRGTFALRNYLSLFFLRRKHESHHFGLPPVPKVCAAGYCFFAIASNVATNGYIFHRVQAPAGASSSQWMGKPFVTLAHSPPPLAPPSV